MGFPDSSDSKESVHNTGDAGSIPGVGRFPVEGVATQSSIIASRIPFQRPNKRLKIPVDVYFFISFLLGLPWWLRG